MLTISIIKLLYILTYAFVVGNYFGTIYYAPNQKLNGIIFVIQSASYIPMLFVLPWLYLIFSGIFGAFNVWSLLRGYDWKNGEEQMKAYLLNSIIKGFVFAPPQFHFSWFILSIAIKKSEDDK